jgi:hypothetical protein
MTTQDSNAPNSQGKSQEPAARAGVPGDDRSKDFVGEESGPSFGGPQEGGRESEADEPGGQAR